MCNHLRGNFIAALLVALTWLPAATSWSAKQASPTDGGSDRLTVVMRDGESTSTAQHIARINASLRVMGLKGNVVRVAEGRYEVRLAAPLLAPRLRLVTARLGSMPGILWASPRFERSEAGQATRILKKRMETDPVPTTVIVRLKSFSSQLKASRNQPIDDDTLASLSAATNVGLRFLRAMSGNAYVLKLDRPLTHAEYQEMLARLAAHPDVDLVEGDWRTEPYYVPNDTRFSSQWNLKTPSTGNFGIDAVSAWNLTKGSAATVVAIIDTGVRPHVELADRLLDGYDFVSDASNSNDGDGRDDNGWDPGGYAAAGQCGQGSAAKTSSWHGTHVAGTVAASSDDNRGIAGIDWKARILPVRVLGACGGTNSDILDGLTWSAGLPVPGVPRNPTPAKVINMSLGGKGECSKLYQETINKAIANGAFIAVAAGNEDDVSDDYSPASCLGVITVAATGPGGDTTPYSNYGFRLEISAPGGDSANFGTGGGILSTVNSGTQGPEFSDYGYKQGTSMASPHVAGVASLMLGINPNLSPAEIYYILQDTVTAFPTNSWCAKNGKCGAGILNAKNATSAALLYLPYRLVYEFKNTPLGHYFRTADANEARAVGNGAAGAGWHDTLDYFYAWAGPTAGAIPVCRFYGTPGLGPNSHFYTANAAECEQVKKDPGWTYEGIAFYAMPSSGGGCEKDYTPVFRTYNGRAQFNDSNHRFTTDANTQLQMIAAGWTGEGIAFCSI